jgi:hypothetical protein
MRPEITNGNLQWLENTENQIIQAYEKTAFLCVITTRKENW